ncbi:MAG: type II toxin-antitoxin system RatA family toxin [Halieaceae bacterium]|nr:type II toxin-antitoxin system RatA family toxin [Halieaceae bacterium]
MTEIHRSAMLPYPAESMFDLVNDIKAYPEFMDGCVGVEILQEEDNTIDARLYLKKGLLKQQIRTRNINTYGRTIDLELLEGPLTKFKGRWEFVALGPQSCKVSLTISFSIKVSVANMGLSKSLSIVSNSLVDAIADRARKLYG